MNEEPNFIVPRPFPLDSSEILERSASLDLTPERPPVEKSKLQRLKKNRKCSERDNKPPPPSSDPAPPPPLSAPQLNSTAHLFNRLCTLKTQEAHHTSRPSQHHHEIIHHAPPISQSETSIVNQGPLKEVNIPRNTARYKNLISVDVSDESFQKLTFKPRIMRKSDAKVAECGPKANSGVKEPCLADLFIPSLECEEADWNEDSPIINDLSSEPVIMNSDDVFALHSLMKSSNLVYNY